MSGVSPKAEVDDMLRWVLTLAIAIAGRARLGARVIARRLAPVELTHRQVLGIGHHRHGVTIDATRGGGTVDRRHQPDLVVARAQDMPELVHDHAREVAA